MIDRTMNLKQSRIAILAVGFCCLLLSGCGDGRPATHKVLGTVEFSDGSAPKFGDVEFYSPQLKINARGKIKRDGTFTVSTFEEGDGAVAGPQQVVIMQQAGSYMLAKTKTLIEHDHGSLIDRKHFDYRTSGLSCEITPGDNQIRLVVKKLPRQTEDGLAK